MRNVMIDLETLGTKPDSVFLSVAAVQFDIRTGKIGEVFFENVDIDSAIRVGRKIDGSTLKWWMEQRPSIMKKMFVNAGPLHKILDNLTHFIEMSHIEVPWGNSASFDIGMLNHAYNQFGGTPPWQFYNERCYRTAIQLLPHDQREEKEDKQAHDPIYDCKYQIRQLVKLNNKLNLQFK